MITLVTGATGTVGAAVVAELVAAGRTVRALVRDVDRGRALLPAVFAWQRGVEFDESTIASTPKGSPYERSKQDADRAIVALEARGLPVRYLHPSAVYGPAPVLNPGLNDLLVRLVKRQIPMLLPGGIPVVFAPDVARGHVLAERAPIGARFILHDRFVALADLARLVVDTSGRGTVPRVLPTVLARTVSIVGEAVAKLTRRAPLIPAGQLQFLLEDVRPSAARARRDLGLTVTPLADGLRTTLAAFADRGWLP